MAAAQRRRRQREGRRALSAVGEPVRSRPVPGGRLGQGLSVRLPRRWCLLSHSAAALAAAGGIAGLLAGDLIYGGETAVLADAAMAQDAVNLVLLAPLLVLLGTAAVRGSPGAYLVWLGCLWFAVYNYAIYAFSVHFGPLFLLWLAVLGLSTFAVVGGTSSLRVAAIEARYAGRRMPVVGWLLIVVATLFAALWLREIVADLLAGGMSRSASDWKVPTNPVHVLDLAVFLPGVATTGVLLLRRHPLGYATAPGQLVFLALTCVPIMVTPLVAHLRGHEPGWLVVIPVGVVLAAAVIALLRTLRGMALAPTAPAVR
ncbi:hypothetical protein OHA72_56745 [Dactylosporangium sp. NBC_01737]|uniref:hypothetical protein n=1 Tax=Dactylosporangium sp. NBC_01737 TaxID=2975959 RepID=UPI002E1604E5|nr:hypothetical protein OHA72_56745 [Dactylosporangium sp. NBC_01737]